LERVTAFIDGFNIYHSLVEAHLFNRKWLDYFSLARAFVKTSTQLVTDIYYFSAIVPWDQHKAARHRTYISALRSVGVNVALGKFKTVTRRCQGTCKEWYKTYEEKETDVNIALTLLRLAMEDAYDVALLFSGDSDLVPAINAVKRAAPHKHLKVVIPFGRSAVDLKNACDSSAQIKRAHIDAHQLPNPVLLGPGNEKSIHRPAEWA